MSLYWIDQEGGRLGIMPRPRGNDWLSDDLGMLRQAGVDIIVSALTALEAEELGLAAEAQECAQNDLLFTPFLIEDRSVPTSQADFGALVNQLLEYSRKGKAIGVHCRAGIERSSMIAACILIRNGLSVESAFQAIEESRGCPVPDTPEQWRWVERFSVSTEPRLQRRFKVSQQKGGLKAKALGRDSATLKRASIGAASFDSARGARICHECWQIIEFGKDGAYSKGLSTFLYVRATVSR